MTIRQLLPGISLLPLNDRAGFGYCQFVEHPNGNILLPRGKASLSECFDWIEDKGGIKFILISDRHFSGPGSVEAADRFGAKLVLSTIEAKAAAKRCLIPDPLPFEKTKIGRSIVAIPTPGHTAGQFCYLIELNSQKILFTGDFVRWEFGQYLPGNKSRAKMRKSLESLRNYEFSRIMGGTCYDDDLGSFIDVDDVNETIDEMIAGCPST